MSDDSLDKTQDAPMGMGDERQITQGPGGRILTNFGVWSPDGQWIVYDTRSDAEGGVFDGTTIAMVHAETGEVRKLYEARHGACCGVATFHPRQSNVVFILGPENPTLDWLYSPSHRQGVLVDTAIPGVAVALDACDLAARTPGALRGGSHVHVFSPDGEWVSFTYNDALLAALTGKAEGRDMTSAMSVSAFRRDRCASPRITRATTMERISRSW